MHAFLKNMSKKKTYITFIVPTLNCELLVTPFKKNWQRELERYRGGISFKFVFIDGGSMDNTRSFLLSEGFLPNAIFLELRGSSIYEAWNFGLDKIFSHGGEIGSHL